MISKETLRQVVMQQNKELLKPQKTVKRELLDKILTWFKDSRVIILTGIRRSGKSVLLKQIIENKNEFCYVNFEDERFINFKAEEFETLNEVLIEVYGNSKIYFFDEIQNIDKFETFVRRLQDQGKKVVITGSNASLLSKELGTRLTGRYKSFEVYPFSFYEFLLFKEIKIEKNWEYLIDKKIKIIKLFNEYLNTGGMPEYLKNKDIEYIKTVYENILYRDIISRYAIKKQKIVKELINILTTNISSKFTYNSLKKPLGLANSITIKEYIGYFSNAYLFFELQKFDFSIKRQLSSPKKIYQIDPAFNQIIGLNFSINKGKKLENIVFIELKRRNKDLYYYSNESECDFLIKEGNKVIGLVQVCYVLDEKNKEREINGLIEAMEKFKLKQGLILTMEQEDQIIINDKKILIKPIFVWILENSY